MSTLDTALRILPRVDVRHAAAPGGSWSGTSTSSRDAWLVVVSGFFEPLFYLLALGIGVGALVGTRRARRRVGLVPRVRRARAPRRRRR